VTTPALVTAALVGTARARAAAPATGTAVDALTEAQAAEGPERALLLRAGAWTIYKAAGYIAADAESDTDEPPAPETLLVCPPAAAALLDHLLCGPHGELLPEALERVARAGCRLPSALLPAALSRGDTDERAKLLPVLGERGRWLARFNPRWSWVTQTLADTSGALPADAETIWQEGTAGQRVEILRRLRAMDPAQARAWLEPVWKREKVEVRADLLNALETGLSAEDEPLLEQALDDRVDRVRSAAARLLERLPTSTLAGRMRTRAEATLVYTSGKLDAKPPTAVDKDWARDGLPEKAPSGAGERTWWLIQSLMRVPPSHWERHFVATPEALIAATEGSKWRIQIVEAWTDAAERFGASERAWAVPLWRFWQAATDKEIKQARGSRDSLREQVTPLLSTEEREAWALTLIADPAAKNEPDLDDVLDMLPMPWTKAVGTAYIQGLRACGAALTHQSQNAEPWEDTLDTAARALPPACFAAALEPIPLPEVPDGKRPSVPYFRNWLESFAETIRLRQRIREEIPLP
jgi:hypothetical protein